MDFRASEQSRNFLIGFLLGLTKIFLCVVVGIVVKVFQETSNRLLFAVCAGQLAL